MFSSRARKEAVFARVATAFRHGSDPYFANRLSNIANQETALTVAARFRDCQSLCITVESQRAGT